VPLWAEIMGIIVMPLSLVTAGIFFYARREILDLLYDHGYLQTVEDLYPFLTEQAVLTIAIIIITGISLALILTRSLARPLQRLIDTIRQVEQGDLTAWGKAAAESRTGAGTKIWIEIPLVEDLSRHD
jgi:methyl-accepting chemotaxis protein